VPRCERFGRPLSSVVCCSVNSAVPVETVLRGPASRYARKWLKQQSNDVHLARLPATLSNDDERMDRRFVRCTLLTVCGNLSQEREAGVALTEAR